MTPEREDEAGYKLPCDVHIPPNTFIRKGCDLETLMVGIRAREKFPAESVTFPRSPAPAGAGEAEKLAEIFFNACCDYAAEKGWPCSSHGSWNAIGGTGERGRECFIAGINAILATLRRAQPPQQTGGDPLAVLRGLAANDGNPDQHVARRALAIINNTTELFHREQHPTGDVEGLSEEEREHLRWLKTAGVGSATITAELLAIIDRQSDALQRMTQLPEDVKGLVDELRQEASAFKGPCLYQRLLTSSADALVAANSRSQRMVQTLREIASACEEAAHPAAATCLTKLHVDDLRGIAAKAAAALSTGAEK